MWHLDSPVTSYLSSHYLVILLNRAGQLRAELGMAATMTSPSENVRVTYTFNTNAYPF